MMRRAGLLLMAPLLLGAAPAAPAAPTPPLPKKVDLGPDAYPETARNAGVEGDIAIELQIDGKGVVTGCDVTKGAELPSELAAGTCALAKANWRFLPARGAAGQNVPGRVTYAIAFRISRRCPPPSNETICVFL
ncbi:TonB family protein [Sandarakinorhabdus sp.]|uniref:TonB family protein n=1 Tax=Sandarakinorhabdus sp. TaxID=1916663 RepID=UPI0035638AA9